MNERLFGPSTSMRRHPRVSPQISGEAIMSELPSLMSCRYVHFRYFLGKDRGLLTSLRMTSALKGAGVDRGKSVGVGGCHG